MFYLELKFADFGRLDDQLTEAADQMPFICASLLNDGAFKARNVWKDATWPNHIEQRNQAFMNAALRVDKATKQSLSVTLYDRLGMTYLQRLAKGGTKTPRGAAHLAVPAKAWRRPGPHGLPASQKLQNIIARTPKRALRITTRGVYVGENGRLQLRYSFKVSVKTPKSVPFYEDFDYVMRESMRTGYADMLRKAMATRR